MTLYSGVTFSQGTLNTTINYSVTEEERGSYCGLQMTKNSTEEVKIPHQMFIY